MVEQRTVAVKLDGNVNPFIREMAKASAATKAFTNELDTSTDRTAMLTQSLLAVGPALVPLTAAAIPAISGLTSQLGFAVAGAGVAVLAFQGVGDALKATNDYAIEPTEANLAKMKQSLAELGPAGREFVGFLQEIRPQLQDLQDAAQAGLFPGMQTGIEDLMTRLPQVERIIGEISGAIGDLMAEAGDNLADPRWDEFFNFIETEARTTLVDFGRTIGNLGEGFANLWMAFDPLSDNFSKSFLGMARDFASWTDGLDQTEGFQEFIAYIERVGPKAWDTLGALGNALLQVVEAAAPVGEVALPVIEAVADILATVADSPAGPALIGAAAGISALSRTIAIFNSANGSAFGALMGKSAFAGLKGNLPSLSEFGTVAYRAGQSSKYASEQTLAARASVAQLRPAMVGAAGAVGALALSMTDVDEKLGISNTAMLGLSGLMFGPFGAALGAGVGLALDFAAGNDKIAEAMQRASDAVMNNVGTLEQQAEAIKAARDAVDEGPSGLAGLFGDAPGQAAVNEAAFAALENQHQANAAAAQDLKFAEAGLGDSMDNASESARNEAEAIIDLRNQHNLAAEAALSQRDAERAYEAAIDGAADAVKKNGQTLDKHTPKGRENAEAVDRIADSFNKMDYATQQANGGVAAARAEFIKARVAAGGSADAAGRLADQLLQIKSPPPIKLSVLGGQTAIDVANNLGNALGRLRDKSITITTNRVGSSPGGTGPTKSGYTGMRIPAGYAVGGQPDEFSGRVPGTPPADPTKDNVAAVTALGNPLRVRSREWIINERQSDKNDRWLRAINNGLNLDELFGRATLPGFASGGRYDDFTALKRSSKLDLARQEQQIIDLQKSLNETETVGKGKNKHKRQALRGHAREVAELELKAAKAELAKMKRENAALKNYGTEDQEEALRDQAELDEDNAKKAVEEAERVVKEAADRFTSAKTSAADRFSIGSATSAAQVDRNLTRLLADSQTFLGLLGDLKGKGASPWLLGELVKAGPTRGAIRLAREYNTNQAALDSINGRALQIDQYTNAYAGLVGNSQFSAQPAWNSGVTAGPQQPMVASIVGAEVSVGQDGLMRFVQGQIVVSQGAEAMEARFG